MDCKSYRRFGVEIEVNTLDGRCDRPDTSIGEISPGADLLARLIYDATHDDVEICAWDYYHNNKSWIIKHDTSCGMEANSPILKGWIGLKKLMKVVESIGDSKLTADERCSLHVHLNIADLNPEQLATVFAYYIKCEPVIFDSFPYERKHNRYCQLLSLSDKLKVESRNRDNLISLVGESKYYSLNAYHFMKGGGFIADNSRRKAIEFRTAENHACVDPIFVKCWVRFLLHFVDVTKNLPYPGRYIPGNRHTGLCWLEVDDVMNLLKFNEKNISVGLSQVRDWFVKRLKDNVLVKDEYADSLWTEKGRKISIEQVEKLTFNNLLEEDHLYGRSYII